MRLPWLCLLATPALAAQPAAAQEDLPIPAPATIERMCSPAGAFQYRFGQTGVPGADRLTRTMSKGFVLPAAAAPFEHGNPWATEWSDRFFGIEYTAPPLDEDALLVFVEELDIALSEAGWELKPDDYDPPLYMLTVAGDWTWTRQDPGAPEPTELVLGLGNALGELTLSCGRSDLMRAHAEEAFGRLPPGTPRPQVPEIPVPALRSAADCDKPEAIADAERMLAAHAVDGFMATMMARTTYRDRLTSWMLWKLDQSGKITPEKLLDLTFSSVGKVSPGGNPFAQFEMLDEMIALFTSLAEAEKSADPAALCRSMVPLHDWFVRVDALTLKQTEATQAALTAEAARLGVSFD